MLNESFFAIGQYGHEVTLWILIALSVTSLSVIIERYITYMGIRRNSEKVAERIREIVKTNDKEKVNHLSEDWNTLEGRALDYGLRHIKENGTEGLEDFFELYSKSEQPQLEKSLNFLATVGSNAPFIGLLGTVFGVMESFQALSEAGGEPSAVMAGIAQALVATAIGLMVAIPAVIAYNYFQKQLNQVNNSLDSVKDLLMTYAKTMKGKNA
ncbi:MAG: tolQ protein [Bdellovibrionaceae bacterium]|nr:tolQ protein [Pseudobdellovibrionaceae bacterium]|tara:strand:+ start:111777 stop:112412 length:636 start_codon:yes stop_codon:yes gene_type:complete